MLPCKPIPLQVRIDQVLIASQDIVLLFRLADMIGFYGTMVTSLLGQGAGLSKTVTACHDAATARFYDLVKQQSVAMLQAAGRYPADLLPPRVVQETLSRLVSPASVVRASNSPFFPCAQTLILPCDRLCCCLFPERHLGCVQSLHGSHGGT
jgi:hypothetical protein